MIAGLQQRPLHHQFILVGIWICVLFAHDLRKILHHFHIAPKRAEANIAPGLSKLVRKPVFVKCNMRRRVFFHVRAAGAILDRLDPDDASCAVTTI